MGKARVLKTIVVRAPIEHVFERLADHEAMANWPGVSAASLVKEGTPRNGVGAVRRLRVNGLTLLEEIKHFDPPHRLDYSVIKGLPVNHLGSVRLTAQEGAEPATTLTWEITMDSRWPLVCGIIGHQLKGGLGKALAFFKQDTEGSWRG